MTEDLQAQAPFSFDCHRCGNCCRVGHGQVWVTQEDVIVMAKRLQMPLEGFVARFVRSVDGRLSIREERDGSCSLLDGGNACTVYAERPQQCRTFPYWPQLMQEGRALEMASGYCQGIQRYPSSALAATVLPQVQALLATLGSPHAEPPSTAVPWASSLEVDLYLASGVCWIIEDPVQQQQLRQQLQDLADASGYPWSYAPWERLLADRRGGWSTRGDLPAISPA
ncbi:MAG: YkgJ family cysteine cluster protein [Planctomycetota bacterium]